MGVNEESLRYLLNESLKLNRRAIAKTLTLIEGSNASEVLKLIRMIGQLRREYVVIGVSGAPGVGKSSLVNLLISRLGRTSRVAVVALDPSSTLSGGSLLGDRVRIRYLNENVFFRSLSTPPGIDVPWYAYLIVEFLGRVGFDYILVEQPGAGQVDIGIRDLSDILILVLQPLTGDDIQMMKAGLLEIADIYVINKFDLPQAELFYNVVKSLISNAPVIRVSTLRNYGIDELIKAIISIEKYIRVSGELKKRRLRRVVALASSLITNRVNDVINNIREEFLLRRELVSGELSSTVELFINEVLRKLCD